MKRLISTVLILMFLIMVVPISASAEYSSELYDTIREGVKNFETNISVEHLNPTEDEINEAMYDLLFNEPDFFYLALDYGYSYYNTFGGIRITTVNVKYNIPTDEIEQAVEYVDAQLDAIVATLPTGLDDVEKALYFHDYICLNFEYDLSYSIYDIYTMLKQGTAVCQGYALLYDALLARVGIETSAVLTTDHMWNQVKLNNKWYHVDVTWDDPVSDLFGRADHEWFLQSDTAVSADSRKTGFDAKYTSGDTSFDNLVWCDQTTPFAFANGDIYCLDDNIISRMDIYTGAHTYVYTVTDKWHSEYGTYVDCLSGFGSYKNKIIFNSDKEIKYLDPTDLTVGSVAIPDIPDNEYIYRMYVSGNKAVFMYDTSYSRTGEIDSVEILFSSNSPACTHLHTYFKTLSDGSKEIRCLECNELLETIPAPTPHVHDDGEWTTLDDGSQERRCTECGELLETIPAPAPHVHDDGEWTTLDDGSQERRCTECGELLETIPAPTPHVHDDGEWTTLADGSKELRCTECGELLDSEPAPEQPPVVLGDVNNDGSVDMFDYLMVKSFYFEVTVPTDDQFIRADMNQDGVIDMFDYLLVKSAYFNS